jgi:8-oxo-dGTP pyrophosphatase MutT (NUDIX family)
MPRTTGKPAMETRRQVSAGGVAYRKKKGRIEVALIRVGPDNRWQLPKGIVDDGESPSETAIREVREEAGIHAEIIDELETIEYWYVSGKGDSRVRFHKYVHFFLMKYISGSTDDHDFEVEEARMVEIEKAISVLSFESERKVAEMARQRLTSPAK